MQPLAEASAKTHKRFQDELRDVQRCVQRELIRAGVVGVPEGDSWEAAERFAALSKIEGHAEEHRLVTVFYAAEEVRLAYESTQGAREFLIAAFQSAVGALRQVDEAMHDSAGTAYLTNAAGIGSLLAFQDEARVDSRELSPLCAELDWNAIRAQTKTFARIAELLVARRPGALASAAYGSRGAGPFAHFLYELSRPMTPPEEIERTVAAWQRVGTSVDPDQLAEPALSLREIAEIAGAIGTRRPDTSDERWEDHCDQAVERVRQRILRFAEAVKAATAA